MDFDDAAAAFRDAREEVRAGEATVREQLGAALAELASAADASVLTGRPV
jgi:hypothetical protein